MKFDPTRPVKTRNGRPAKIIDSDLKSEIGKTIIAKIEYPHYDSNNGKYRTIEEIKTFFSNGRFDKLFDGNEDLVNIPEKVKLEGWLNVYRENSGLWTGAIHSNKPDADKRSAIERFACIKIDIDVEEGEGL